MQSLSFCTSYKGAQWKDQVVQGICRPKKLKKLSLFHLSSCSPTLPISIALSSACLSAMVEVVHDFLTYVQAGPDVCVLQFSFRNRHRRSICSIISDSAGVLCFLAKPSIPIHKKKIVEAIFLGFLIDDIKGDCRVNVWKAKVANFILLMSARPSVDLSSVFSELHDV